MFAGKAATVPANTARMLTSNMYPKSGLKAPVCPYHQLVHLSADAKWQVNGNCEPPDKSSTKNGLCCRHLWSIITNPGIINIMCSLHFRPDCTQAENGNAMEVIYPKNGAKIYVPLEADGTRGRMICNAAHRLPGMKIFWHLDDQYVGETKDFHQMALNPGSGQTYPYPG
jgi:penicillin-binding protein 1C